MVHISIHFGSSSRKTRIFVVVVDVLVIFISVKKNLQPQRFGGDGGDGGGAQDCHS